MLAPDSALPQLVRTSSAAPDPQLVEPETLFDLIVEHGGFTIHHACRERLRSGIAVCAEPTLAWAFPPQRWDHRAVADWLRSLGPRLQAGDVQLGGWHDRAVDLVWLEPVWVLPEHLRGAALTIARAHRQRAVFDLRDQAVIPVELLVESDLL